MKIDELIKLRLSYCERRLEYLEKCCGKLPEGRLYSYSKAGGTYWRYTDKTGERRYLPKSELETAKKLALRQIYEAEIKDLRSEQESCLRFLRYFEAHYGKLKSLLSKDNKAFKELTGKIFRTEDERLDAWANAPYKRSVSHPENLKILTSQKFKVRSKSEALIAECLYQLNVPARYEQINTFGTDSFATDFTVLNPITHAMQYIEYFGMMDLPDYTESYVYKVAAYTKAGIIPDIDILYFHETKDSKIDMAFIRMRLENFIFGRI